MGKRELLIVATFIVVGVAAWRLTAPTGPNDNSQFSLATVAEFWRNRNRPAGTEGQRRTTRGQIVIDQNLTEVRVSGQAAVDIRGETRTDIGWTLDVPATGSLDIESGEAVVGHDNLGTVLNVSVLADETRRRGATLTLQVPSRLRVRVESARRTTISSVAAVRLENLVGETDLRSIEGAIDGGHRNSALTIDGAEDVLLSLVGSTATVRGVRETVRLNARDGSTRIEAPGGAVRLDVSRQHVTVVEPAAAVRAGVIGGAITIVRPAAGVDVDARRSRVAVEFARPVPATIFAAEGEVHLTVPDPARFTLDAASNGGTIDASVNGLATTDRDGRAHATSLAKNGPRVSVRAERSAIVIVPAK